MPNPKTGTVTMDVTKAIQDERAALAKEVAELKKAMGQK
jgi:ribosomal protein L1